MWWTCSCIFLWHPLPLCVQWKRPVASMQTGSKGIGNIHTAGLFTGPGSWCFRGMVGESSSCLLACSIPRMPQHQSRKQIACAYRKLENCLWCCYSHNPKVLFFLQFKVCKNLIQLRSSRRIYSVARPSDIINNSSLNLFDFHTESNFWMLTTEFLSSPWLVVDLCLLSSQYPSCFKLI